LTTRAPSGSARRTNSSCRSSSVSATSSPCSSVSCVKPTISVKTMVPETVVTDM
jgi:hypothetical protein